MTDRKPSPEGTTEQILASIRRTIAEEKGETAPAPADADVLELTREVRTDGVVVDCRTGAILGRADAPSGSAASAPLSQDLVRGAVEPVLARWANDTLPRMVETLVRRELAGRGRDSDGAER